MAELILDRALGLGEQAALRWLEFLGGGLLLSDDQVARATAVTLGFSVMGTVGILLQAGRTGQLGWIEVRELVRSLRRTSSLHVSDDFIAAVLASLPE